jgi:hypothetical protein
MEKAPEEWFNTYGAKMSSKKKLKKTKDGLSFKIDHKG